MTRTESYEDPNEMLRHIAQMEDREAWAVRQITHVPLPQNQMLFVVVYEREKSLGSSRQRS